MKVLTHEGVLLTLPTDVLDPEDAFDRLDGQGSAVVGVVGELEERTVRRTANEGAALESIKSTASYVLKDLQFISKALSGVADGAEVRVECRGGVARLVVPPGARSQRPPIVAGDRVAFNGRVTPEALLNARGTVESVEGGEAKVRLDAGDRRRLEEATGKDRSEFTEASVALLDKLDTDEH
jgi:hypothetical protein